MSVQWKHELHFQMKLKKIGVSWRTQNLCLWYVQGVLKQQSYTLKNDLNSTKFPFVSFFI